MLQKFLVPFLVLSERSLHLPMGDHTTRMRLRMQRELNMLFSDPPPGVSLVHPSPNSSINSLSSIEAQLEGPQGSAYREGVFCLKIQIPDRYPLHPPIVTFKTPIYHPNIDEGGRVCLDILNLPPKGAWQPSLNISTVLMSIGLLLSEPNPDDGVAHEASREYKYDRQAFDKNARSWTEKFAKATKICPAEANNNLLEDFAHRMDGAGNVTQKIDDTKNLYKNSYGGIPASSSLESITGERKEVDTAVGLECHRQICRPPSPRKGALSIQPVEKQKMQKVECNENCGPDGRRLKKLSLSLSKNKIGSSSDVPGTQHFNDALSENHPQVQMTCEDANMVVPFRDMREMDGLQPLGPNSCLQSRKRELDDSIDIVPDSDSDEEENVKPPAKLRLSLSKARRK